jgi:hypothetical protein
MPYDTYRLYQIERPKSPAEVRRADEQAARLASAVSSLFRASRGPGEPCGGHPRPRRVTCPARLHSRPPADLPMPGGLEPDSVRPGAPGGGPADCERRLQMHAGASSGRSARPTMTKAATTAALSGVGGVEWVCGRGCAA